MTELHRYRFEPAEPIPAGETLADWLERSGMRQSQFARRTGLTPKHINQVIAGSASLSPEVAVTFERVTTIPARYWNQLEANYQSAQHRRREATELAGHLDLLDRFPIRQLKKLGYIKEAAVGVDALRALLTFFAVATPAALQAVVVEPALYRKSNAFTSDDGALACWLRIAELRAAEVKTAPFDRDACLRALPQIRSLSRCADMAWRRPLTDLCASFGIVVVILKELPGCRVNGATRWLSQDKAMIVLSLRHRRNDIFWFTLLHELCHVLRHGKKRTFVDNDHTTIEKDLEEEADAFAARQLVPVDAAHRLVHLHTAAEVEALAEELQVAPGIIVGRMRHQGLIPHSRWSKLIEPYRFDDD